MSEPSGYDASFLPVELDLPGLVEPAEVRVLPSTHFTVILLPARRMAVSAGVNIDGAQLVDVTRGDDWHFDARAPESEQTGPDVYADNDLDRGHLVRRVTPAWGDQATAEQADYETFSYANAAPQAALFNQGEMLWAGLENYVLEHARTDEQKLSVFTAPIFADDDLPYRGILVPRRFFKIASWVDAETALLAATGYVLDQSPQLDLIDWTVQEDEPPTATPPLGAYLTYQVPIGDIATLTGLDLAALTAADQLTTPEPAAVLAADLDRGSATIVRRWHELHALTDIQLLRTAA